MPHFKNYTLKEIAEIVRSDQNTVRIADDTDRYTVYNGKLRDLIQRAINKEFKKNETVEQLVNRIIPINIVQKIVDKLATLYLQPPRRQPMDKNPSDQELIDQLSIPLQINRQGKVANRYLKLHKHLLWEPYLDGDGVPRLRTLPSQDYTPIATDPLSPDKPGIIVKSLIRHSEQSKRRFAVWTDENFWVIDGNGNIDFEQMKELGNPEGVNPFGKLPFVFIADSDGQELIPISDDDLISMQVVISILLTDLAFASKYQLWSIIVIKGAQQNASITWNPNSLVKLPQGVDIEAIKPQLDTDQALSFIETLVGMLLTTKNLSVGDITGSITGVNPQSGVAALIDRAETTEDRLDQEQFFIQGERDLWKLIAHTMMPVWVQSKKISPEYVGKFSENFRLSITFADPKPIVSDDQMVDLEIKKLENKLTTRMNALRTINPDMDMEEIEILEADIREEAAQAVRTVQSLMQRSPQEEIDDGIDAEN